jgi:hypothetical protein
MSGSRVLVVEIRAGSICSGKERISGPPGDMKGVPVTRKALHEKGDAVGAGEFSTDRIGSAATGDRWEYDMDCIPASLIVGGVFDKFSKKDEVRGEYTSLTHVDSAAGGGDCESILDDGIIKQNQRLSQDGKLGVEYKRFSENNPNMH